MPPINQSSSFVVDNTIVSDNRARTIRQVSTRGLLHVDLSSALVLSLSARDKRCNAGEDFLSVRINLSLFFFSVHPQFRASCDRRRGAIKFRNYKNLLEDLDTWTFLAR